MNDLIHAERRMTKYNLYTELSILNFKNVKKILKIEVLVVYDFESQKINYV